MMSKTKISKRMKRKIDSELVETILLAKKHNLEIAKILSGPTRKRISINLDELDKKTKGTAIVLGKVLGNGKINKKIKVIALNFSSSAEEKLKKAGCEITSLKKELEKNKKLTGEILK